MKTPIVDFVAAYAAGGTSRLHMPGHKGIPFLGCEPLDITEIGGADALFEADGIIAESEHNATALFGTGRTFYSVEGSSHCIRSMVFLSYQHRPNRTAKPVILAARNVHKTFLYAAALVDAAVEWLYPTTGAANSICACQPSAAAVQQALETMQPLPFAVYLTSPDYLGQVADIRGIAAVCHRFGIPLLVDNAHGAYLHFLQEAQHPIDLGADLCCDSAHKTLPALTGAAYLHLSRTAAEKMGQDAKSAMSLFGSTSPSYLILQSLDLCNRYLDDHYRERLAACIGQVEALEAALCAAGVPVLPCEPLKLVPDAAAMGCTGRELQEHLRERGVEAEFADADYLVLMLTPENPARDYDRVREALTSLPHRPARATTPLSTLRLPRGLSIREAVFAPHEMVPASQAAGRICGAPTVSCPPAVPIAISGEIITPEVLPLFAAYGVESIAVVRKGAK